MLSELIALLSDADSEFNSRLGSHESSLGSAYSTGTEQIDGATGSSTKSIQIAFLEIKTNLSESMSSAMEALKLFMPKTREAIGSAVQSASSDIDNQYPELEALLTYALEEQLNALKGIACEQSEAHSAAATTAS